MITESVRVGTLCGENIFRVLQTDIIPYSRTTLHLTEDQIQFNSTYLSMLKTVLNTQNFYFCNSFDITHSLQRLSNAGPDFVSSSLIDRVSALLSFRQQMFDNYCLY